MTDPQVGMLMLGLFIFIIMLGFPIAFTLMAMGVGFGFYAYYVPGQEILREPHLHLAGAEGVRGHVERRAHRGAAIPLHGLCGRAREYPRSPVSLSANIDEERAGRARGRDAVTCAMFATATGIVGAVVTLMGLLAFPAMLRAGYDVRLSAGVVCAGGCLGILIPPSILLIVYAATAGVSAVKLYAAAFIPGFILTGFYILYVIVRAPDQSRRWPPSCRRSRPIFRSPR